MAKALVGHLQIDPGASRRVAAENVRLRGRVAELEALVTRLMEENDRLAVSHSAHVLEHTDALEMQPA